jgi:paraquat-inducible protein A
VSAGVTAMSRSLASCHDCSLLVQAPPHDAHASARCPRCGARLHARKPDSINRTWALLVAALILYIPANLFPVMKVTALGKVQADTILSGAAYLLHHGQWPLALIIFVASVLVPLLKMVAIAYLLISVQRRSTGRLVDRTRIYRITEAVGRWSMVDIYVVTIMVALVQLGALATIEAQPGALYFGGVVVLSMLAAESFDPRLIWDSLENAND